VSTQPGSAGELERQLAETAAVLSGRWVPFDAEGPRVLRVSARDAAVRFNKRGGWTGVDPATLQAVHRGARAGDPLPPRQPGYYLDLVTDAEVIITGSGEDQRVAVLFSHRHFPGVRFGHRFPSLGLEGRAAFAPEEDIETGESHYMEFAPVDGRGAAFALIEEVETGTLHRMMEFQRPTDEEGVTWTTWGARPPGLDGQRALIEMVLVGWEPVGGWKPRALTERAYTEARKILGRGGWTGLDPATIEAVRGGAQAGDPLPPLEAGPYIRDVTDAEVIITGTGQGRRVAVLFSHKSFPGARFGHRFPLGLDTYGGDPVYLMEEIETGALDRMMETEPAADDNGIMWTTWGDPDPDVEGGPATAADSDPPPS
jgi:hypothetical protein